MKLIGARITKINAVRNPDFSGKLELKTNIKINSVETVKDSKGSLKVGYDFKIDYGELGNVEVSGLIFFSADSKVQKEIQKQWKDKKLDSPEFIMITNMILQKSSIKAFELEEELGLPIHIKLPSLSLKK